MLQHSNTFAESQTYSRPAITGGSAARYNNKARRLRTGLEGREVDLYRENFHLRT